VERIDADRGGVTKLVCRRFNEEVVVQARHYALAAGAYATPMLLLGSANACWPNGIANSSDMVGRNLMFHVSDFLAVWPRGRGKNLKAERAIAVRDYDRSSYDQLGMIQSAGMSASPRNIMHVLNILIDTGRFKWLRSLRRFVQVPAVLVAWALGRATIFATIIEDHPYPGNRVRPDRDYPGTIFFEYTVSEELRQRVRRFRRLYRQAFRRRRTLVLTPEVNLNFGHPCGTCRAGLDPRNSVVDAQNRTHDLKNLYVVDASIFPTSGGVNPSLTVAASALRAGSLLVASMAETALTAAGGIHVYQGPVPIGHDARYFCAREGEALSGGAGSVTL
jgi:choline dehydrogenase-like flavoprotein